MLHPVNQSVIHLYMQCVCIILFVFVFPVFSLRERCMQIVRGHVNQDCLDQLDLPVSLIRDLKISARPQFPSNQREQVTW